MRETSSALLARITFPTRVLWLAFGSATLIYGVVVWLVTTSPDRPPVDRGPLADDPLVPALTLAAIAAIVAGRILPRRMLLAEPRLREAAAREVAEAFRGNPNMPPADLAAIAALPAVEQRPFKLLSAWSTALILEWAAFDVVAVLGLVLAFLRREPMTFVPFGAVSLLLLLATKPRVEHLLELAQRSGQPHTA